MKLFSNHSPEILPSGSRKEPSCITSLILVIQQNHVQVVVGRLGGSSDSFSLGTGGKR